MKDIERIKADLEVLVAHPPKDLDADKFAQLVEDTKKAISAKSYHELKRFVSLYVSQVIVRNDDISVVVSFTKIVLLVGGPTESKCELMVFCGWNYDLNPISEEWKLVFHSIFNPFVKHMLNNISAIIGS